MEPLYGDGLLLRPLRASDAEAFAAAARESVSSVGRWMDWCRADYPLAEAQEWVAATERERALRLSYEMGVFDARNGAFLGGTGLNQINQTHNFCNLGYWVRESCQGHGIATRAARILTGFGLQELGLTRIEIVIAEDNAPSRAVARNLGALLEGVARNRLVIHGSPVAAAVYSLVP